MVAASGTVCSNLYASGQASYALNPRTVGFCVDYSGFKDAGMPAKETTTVDGATVAAITKCPQRIDSGIPRRGRPRRRVPA